MWDDQTLGAVINGIATKPRDPQGFDHELGNYVGIGPDITPEFISFGESLDYSFLLSTDGTWGALGELFEPVYREAQGAQESVRRILTTINYAGGSDNASLIVTPTVKDLLRELRLGNGSAAHIRIEVITANGYISISAPKKDMEETVVLKQDVQA